MEYRIPNKFEAEGDNLEQNWKKFLQRFELYLLASGKDEKTKDDSKIALLLNIGGEDLLEVYNGLELYKKEKYDDVKAQLGLHFAPIKNIIYERYKFLSYVSQREDQTVEQYVIELRKLAENCEYRERDNMIRDKFVMGIRNDKLRCRLLDEDKLTLPQAISIAKKFHTVKKQSFDMSGRYEDYEIKPEIKCEAEVGILRGTRFNTKTCDRCGRFHSEKMICPAQDKECNYCRKRGHFAVKCGQRHQPMNRNVSKDYRDNESFRKSERRRVQEIRDDDAGPSSSSSPRPTRLDYSETEEYEFGMATLQLDSLNDDVETEWTEQIVARDKMLKCNLDTGAQCNTISLHTVEALYDENEHLVRKLIKPTNLKLIAYNKNTIRPIGTINIPCQVKGVFYPIKFVVVPFNSKPILGLNTCSKTDLIKRSTPETKTLHSQQEIISGHKLFTGVAKSSGKPYCDEVERPLPDCNVGVNVLKKPWPQKPWEGKVYKSRIFRRTRQQLEAPTNSMITGERDNDNNFYPRNANNISSPPPPEENIPMLSRTDESYDPVLKRSVSEPALESEPERQYDYVFNLSEWPTLKRPDRYQGRM
ncbi:hypothetical protein M8J77_010488 [Diaphorina citri]|nr:hypothetical protein M8J77_006374 [Diaphorina citri]KAI5715094.1 hypothetical protein M8J77_010488 [Diaphorina citri]